jgi:hypothetical protein
LKLKRGAFRVVPECSSPTDFGLGMGNAHPGLFFL